MALRDALPHGGRPNRQEGAHTFTLSDYQAGVTTAGTHSQYADAVITAQYTHTPGPS